LRLEIKLQHFRRSQALSNLNLVSKPPDLIPQLHSDKMLITKRHKLNCRHSEMSSNWKPTHTTLSRTDLMHSLQRMTKEQLHQKNKLRLIPS
jgi:hypothetical protein